jgi:hypothetical protein
MTKAQTHAALPDSTRPPRRRRSIRGRSPEIRPNCRTVDGFDYYSLRCLACGAELSFGQRKDGSGLFPKRKTDDGAPAGESNSSEPRGRTRP